MTPATQSEGVLTTVCNRVRQALDEPTLQAKYTDTRIIERLNEAWPETVVDLYAAASNPPLARYDVTVTDNMLYGVLPATVGEVRRIELWNSDGVTLVGEIIPRSRFNAYGQGIAFEGTHRFRIEPNVLSASVLRFFYVPSGEAVLLKGTTPISQQTSTGLTLSSATTASLGAIDRRPHAYIGSIIRTLSYTGGLPSGYLRYPVEDRQISAYNVATGALTITEPWTLYSSLMPTPLGNLTYEIFPPEAQGVFPVLWLKVARDLCAEENRLDKFKVYSSRVLETRRAMMLAWSRKQTRSPQAYNGDVSLDNPDFNGWGPWGISTW